MFRAFENIARFFENYRFYRNLGMHAQQAWQLAKVTLPD
jgi:hypothetical protein